MTSLLKDLCDALERGGATISSLESHPRVLAEDRAALAALRQRFSRTVERLQQIDSASRLTDSRVAIQREVAVLLPVDRLFDRSAAHFDANGRLDASLAEIHRASVAVLAQMQERDDG